MTQFQRRIFTLLACAAMLTVEGNLLLLAQRPVDQSKMKSSETLRTTFAKASSVADKSTLLVRSDDKTGTRRQISLGTVVSPDGYLLTKGSEVMGVGKVWVAVRSGSGMKDFEAKIVGWSEPLDLAMLKIETSGLTPIVFADTRPPVETQPAATQPGGGGGNGGPGATVAGGPGAGGGRGQGGRGRGQGGGGGRGGRRGNGPPPVLPTVATPLSPPPGALRVDLGEWVASARAGGSQGSDEEPIAVGVISVIRRKIPGHNGFLGVALQDAPNGGAKVMQVVAESPAEKAGLKVDDVVVGVDGKAVRNNLQLRSALQNNRPGKEVTLEIMRDGQDLTMKAVLGVQEIDTEEAEEAKVLAGSVSKRASDFPSVFQHDSVLRPEDCGGPLVDLDGHVLGINIARAGRTESYALPADVIVPLIEPMKSGKMAPVNANSPATRPAEGPPPGAPKGG